MLARDQITQALEEIDRKRCDRLKLFDAAAWSGIQPQKRRWLSPGRIPMGNVTQGGGDGATGKTTAFLQLAVGTVRGTDWLGAVIDEPGPVIFLSAEEDLDEMHRRLDAIVTHHNITFDDLSGLHLICLPGEDALLGSADKSGVIRPTPLLDALAFEAEQIRPSLIVVESAADVFAGNENDRSQVRQFVGLLRGHLAIKTGAAVVLISHPSLSGMNSGTGTSGSTGWNNSVRSRLYFSRVAGDDENSDIRELKVMKSNYGPSGETVRVRWQRGVFVPVSQMSNTERAAAEVVADGLFMKCMALKNGQGIDVSASLGRNYAPTIFEAMPEGKGHRRGAFAAAMERLLASHRIRVAQSGPPSRQKAILVPGEGQ